FTAIGNPDFEPFLSAGNVPVVEQPGKATNGTVTLELELPGGVETYAFETKTIGSGLLPWDCDKVPASGAQHAKAICTRSDSVPSEGAYPPLTVAVALGPDAPDTAIAKATAFGGGAPASASAMDEFVFDPFKEFGLVPGSFKAALLDCAGDEYMQAGGHPCSGAADIVLTQKR